MTNETRTLQIKIEKPSEKDFSAAYKMLHHASALENLMQFGDALDPSNGLELDEQRHLKALSILFLNHGGAISRILMTAQTLLSKENGLVDQNVDTLEFSPRLVKAMNLLELIESEKYLDQLKGPMNGEVMFETEQVCSACHFDMPDENCEVCQGEVHYIQHQNVPWTAMKEVMSLAFDNLLGEEK